MTTNNDQPVVGPRRSSNALPKAKLVPKKIIITIWWSADPSDQQMVIHLNPGETITSEKYVQQTDEMHQKLPHLQQELVNRKGPLFTMTTPNHTLHNQCFKIWATKFCFICHLHLTSLASQPTITSPSIYFDNFFLQENTPTTSRRQKMLSKCSSNPDFYTTGINKLISCWQNCADCNGFYFG